MIVIAKGNFKFNEYKIVDDYAIIYLKRQNGDVYEIYIDLEDLDKVIAFQRSWCARFYKYCDTPYAITNIYYTDENGKSRHKTESLHRFILVVTDSKVHVDHRDNNTLNNRKSNLRQTNASRNAQNRKGANSNSSTGVRNVNLVTRYGGEQEYWVQFCRKGEKFKWEFSLDQFDEACAFADIKRKEIFGDYAGRS